jgi:hypothetical protein
MSDVIEKLAALAHEQWSGWMRHAFKKCGARNMDGTMTMPAWAVDRWQRQMLTPYADLSEPEKDSDRAEARRVLEVLGPPLRWTRTPPTTEGWYWHSGPSHKDPVVVRLSSRFGFRGLLVWRIGIEDEEMIEYVGGEWAGPIPTPGEGPASGEGR